MNTLARIIFALPLLTAPIYSEETTEKTAFEALTYHVVEDKTTLPLLNPALEGRVVEKLVLSNGLRILLISDPGVEQSAAGVAVEVGSWNDPLEYPGMAHFCEHMLFMGTGAYPSEFEYMAFIRDHGGKVNAYTAPDRTVYMFSTNNDAFEQALDRFSHFFIDPLFSRSCIDRELLAVDQEHAKNIEHDGWRQYMILKETGNPNHPNCQFSTGNALTLSGIPQSALKNWYKTHYSAQKMHLAIVSPLPMEELIAIAVEDFSQVPQFKAVENTLPEEITSANQRGHMIFVKPVKDIKQLSLSWEVHKDFANDLDGHIPDLVAYALGQEGEKSLTQVLKEEKIAENVKVGCDRFSKDTLLFMVDISLTDYGVSQIDTAVERVFQAISRLKKEEFPEHLFSEMQTMAKLNYQYQSREDAFEAITRITGQMVYEDLETYPQKSQVPSTFNPQLIHAFAETLTANNCVYFVLADPSKTGIPPEIKEKWMDAQYTIKEIAPARITAWNDAIPTPAIQLPSKNPYIPSSLALVPFSEESKKEQPTLISASDTCKIYYAQDTRYHVPEIAFLFTFKSPLLDNTPKSCALADLYVRAATEKLSSVLSMASSAGLSARMAADDYAIKLSISGYSNKAPLLLGKIFFSLKQTSPSKEEFEIYRQSIAADYDNASKELPVKQAMEHLDTILFSNPSNSEKLAAIKELSYEQFKQFSSNLFQSSYTEGLLYGNLTEKQAHGLWGNLQQTLASKPFAPADQYKKKVLLLSEKYGPYKIVQNTQRQGCGALLLLEEGDFTFEKRAVQQILGSGLTEGFFDTLRTKQQTGYIAQAWNAEEQRQLLQFFAVQSSTHTPTDLLARFELFLEGYDKNLSQLIPEGRFESIRANLITLLQMPPENMPGMTTRLNQLAFEYDDFDWINKRIQSLKELSYKRFSEVSHQFLSRNNPRRLAVLMEGVLTPENDFHYELVTKDDVPNLGTFITIQ